MVKQELGVRIRAARERRGLSQAALALAIGAGNQSTVAGWERGRTEPDGAMLGRLAVALKVSTDFLLGVQEETLSPESLLQQLMRDISELSGEDQAMIKKIVAALKPGDADKIIPG